MPDENADGLTMLPSSAFLVRMVPLTGAMTSVHSSRTRARS